MNEMENNRTEYVGGGYRDYRGTTDMIIEMTIEMNMEETTEVEE